MATNNSSTSNIRGLRGKRTRTYRSWNEMRARCLNPKNKSFIRYGSIGIEICQEWNSFEQFLLDMGERPKGTTIDRKDNSKGYYPENCRWATPLQQSQNTKKVINITHNGETHCLSEWARIIGIWPNSLKWRLHNGWPLEKALKKAAMP